MMKESQYKFRYSSTSGELYVGSSHTSAPMPVLLGFVLYRSKLGCSNQRSFFFLLSSPLISFHPTSPDGTRGNSTYRRVQCHLWCSLISLSESKFVLQSCIGIIPLAISNVADANNRQSPRQFAARPSSSMIQLGSSHLVSIIIQRRHD